MITHDATKQDPIPPARLAEAGVWIARLHGDDRDRALEVGFREWLKENPLNQAAFELSTEVWEDAQNLRRVIPFAFHTAPKQKIWFPFALAATAAILIAGIALVLAFGLQSGGVATEVGEQRLLTLEDGTRIFLNTATRVVVNYDKSTRQVELKTGEALFDVAKQPDRPFVVSAGDRQVRALGTSFVVRRDEQNLAVTLVEGKVTVSSVPGASRLSEQSDKGPRGTGVWLLDIKISKPVSSFVSAWLEDIKIRCPDTGRATGTKLKDYD